MLRRGIRIDRKKPKLTMEFNTKSIRPFIGAKDFQLSRAFYKTLGFDESAIASDFSYFYQGAFGFYLQDAYVKEWVNNTMIFMEVSDVNQFWKELLVLDLPLKFKNAKLVPIRKLDWGQECFLYDPSGILWHFGEFN